MSSIVFSILGLIIYILLAIFTGQISEEITKRQRKKTGNKYFNRYWNTKSAQNTIRVIWIFLAIHSGIVLYLNITGQKDTAISNIVQVYKDWVYPIIGLAMATYFIYFMLKVYNRSDPYDVYAPMIFVNHTGKYLTVYARGRTMGKVRPGEQIFNNDLLASHGSYLIVAKNADGNTVYSKEFNLQELKELNWTVSISSSLNNI